MVEFRAVAAACEMLSSSAAREKLSLRPAASNVRKTFRRGRLMVPFKDKVYLCNVTAIIV